MTSDSALPHDDVVIVGGCGHVGLPLGIALADRGSTVVLYDVDADAVATVNAGQLPFREDGAQEPLRRALAAGTLRATVDPSPVGGAEHVVVVIGTPVDEHLNPDPHAIPRALEHCIPFLRDGQLLILRSTVYPGVTALVERLLAQLGLAIDVAFCPERISEGNALAEITTLPQIVAARDQRVRDRAAALFRRLTARIEELEPEEAELAKLFTNTWRYVKFATANQLWMMANSAGLDYERIRRAVTADYPRAADLPTAGFTAGPCLLKDTMQLAAFNDNQFHLGHAAMLVNEGMPLYLVSRLEQVYPLPTMTVGILGMAFKAESDDTRSSLAYKLRRLLAFKAERVLCSDPYVATDPSLVTLEKLLEEADLLVIAAPHAEYRELATKVDVIDVWNLRGGGVIV